jgi:hypothetical protein
MILMDCMILMMVVAIVDFDDGGLVGKIIHGGLH